MSQKELAGRLGVDPSTLAKWERAERVPTGGFLGRVRDVLDHHALVRADVRPL
jgi:transcriptional regulator with XRE-family HTH domain